MIIENPPEFEDTPNGLSRSEKKKYFSQKVNKIVSDNFNVGQGHLDLSGKQRIYTQFKIDEKGFVIDIKVRSSSHSALAKEAIRVIKLLPKFKPAKQRGKNIGVVYTLPIVIIIED
jgi:protein TonB